MPPTGWSIAPTSGTSNWAIAPASPSNPAAPTHSGTKMAYWNAYSIGSGNAANLVTPVIDWSNRAGAPTTVTIWWYRDQSTFYNTSSYSLEGVTAYVNTAPNLTGAVSMGYVPRDVVFPTSGGVTGTSTPGTPGWYQYTFTVPTTYNSAVNYIIFNAYSQFGDNCYMDDVQWTAYPPGCTGTPTAGTVNASPSSGCSAYTSALSLTGASTATGISYLWQSSPDNSAWSDVTGATNSFYSAGVTSSVYYRCRLTCSSGGGTATTPSQFISLAAPTYATLPVVESFEGSWINACATADAPNNSWRNTPATGNQSWRREDDGPGANTAGWTSPTLYLYSPVSSAGAHSARFHSGWASSGTSGFLDLYVDLSATGTKQLSYDFININGTDVLQVLLSTDGGLTFPTTLDAVATAGSWTNRTVTTTLGTANSVIRFKTISDFGSTDIGIDNVSLIQLLPCTSPTNQPTALTLTSGLFNVAGSFTAATPAVDNYLVVLKTTPFLPTAPSNGTSYTVGSSALGGTIVSAGPLTTFNATGLNPGTTYYFTVYSYNSLCGGGPLYKINTPLTGFINTTNCALSGVKTVGPTGDYPTITAAIGAVNTLGLAGPVAIEIQTSYTGAGETLPIVINSIPCASSVNTLTIRPQGALTLSASVAGALLDLNGANWVIVDGRVGSTGTTKALTLSNTNTGGQDIRFINDASNNVVKYCTILGSSNTTTNANILFSTTTGTTGNDNNLIDNCDVMDGPTTPNNCIYSSGTSGKENSGNTISNCNIANFFNPASASNGIFLTTGNSDWTITNNRIFQTAPRAYTSSTVHRGIWITNTAGNNFVVTGNTVGYASSAGTGTYAMTSTLATTFSGIALSVGSGTASSVQNNVITNISLSSTSTAATVGGVLCGINVTNGSVNVGNITPNRVGSATGTGEISLTTSGSGGTVVGINGSSATPSIVNIQNNVIGSLTANGSTAGVATNINGIQLSSTGIQTVSGNTIGSTTVANSLNATTVSTAAQIVYGINSSSTSAISPVISGNTIANLTGNATSTSALVAGILHSGSAAAAITGNTISTVAGASANTLLSGQTGVCGIAYTGAGSATISQNTINTIVNTNTAAVQSNVAGIGITSSTTPAVTRNRIYDLRNASTGTTSTTPPTAIGINVGNVATSATIANNMISLGNAQTSNTAFTGIMNNTTTTAALGIYHNSVNIEGTVTAGALATAAFHRGNNTATAVTSTVDVKNNIFVNNRAGGTGKHYAIANGINATASTTGWGVLASNYNILNAVNSATVGYWNADQSFATWKTASASDNNSYTASTVNWISTTTGNLHTNMLFANNVESHGTVIASINTDYDNDARPGPVGSINGGGFAPDLGADEYDGVPLDNLAPIISYTTLLPACSTGDRTFTATIADPGSVPLPGSGIEPRVYFKKGVGGTWFSRPGTLSSGTYLSGTWSFTIPAADLGGISLGDQIYYYVIAQDNLGNIGSNPLAGMVATNVNTVTTPPTTPNNYSVVPAIAGTYNVGSAGSFATLSAAVAAYNSSCLTGPVTFNLTDAAYTGPGESFPISINSNVFSSAVNTLTIQPAAGIAANITSAGTSTAVFKLLNASYVTIDGVNAGGSSLTLTNNSTATSTDVWLASASGTGNKYITLKNMTMYGRTNTTASDWCILASVDNTTPNTTAGPNNDFITIQGNNCLRSGYAIYVNGSAAVSAGGDDNWSITGNTFGPSTYSTANNMGYNAMFLQNMVNPTIANNTMQQIGLTTTTSQTVGVYFSSNLNGAVVNNNNINNINASASVSGTSAVCGIYLGTNVLNTTITKNTLTNINNMATGGWGVRGIMVNTGSTVTNATIANNSISDIYNYSDASAIYWAIGIAIEGTSAGVKVYNNSVNLFGDHVGLTSATGSACFFANTNTGGIDLRNNNFVNTYSNTSSSTDKGWAINSAAPSTAFTNIDNNNYFVASPNVLGNIATTDRPSLATIVTGFGGNTFSTNIQPTFVSNTDLHLTSVSGNAGLTSGVPLVSVTTDIDGLNRDAAHPTMGINEVSTPITIPTGPTACLGATSATLAYTNAASNASKFSIVWSSAALSAGLTNITNATLTPGAISFAVPTTISTGVYTGTMTVGNSIVTSAGVVFDFTVNPAPSLIDATSTTPVCAGSTLTLSANGPINVTGYTWTGPVAITDATLATATVPTVTSAAAGTYTVVVNNGTGNGCRVAYTTSVTVNPQPNVTSFATLTNLPCQNTAATVTVNSSSLGNGTFTVVYDLSGSNVSTGNTATLVMSGGTGSFSSVVMANAGVTGITITSITNALGCTRTVTSGNNYTLYVYPAPIANNVTGSGAYCAGGAGLEVILDASEADVEYQLYDGTTMIGSVVPGAFDGSAISFGFQTTAATYTVQGRNTVTGCLNTMAGSAVITVNPLPNTRNITGGGHYCAGGTGVSVGLDTSDAGITYQLYLDGVPVLSPLAGTGSALDFGLQTTPGVYNIVATDDITLCTQSMNGSDTVVADVLPVVYNVIGGGAYCATGAGVDVAIDGSETGISYQLVLDGTPLTGLTSGTGDTLHLGLQTAAGLYTVIATNDATHCASDMSANATVSINPLPALHTVTGGGNYCAGGTGVSVGLDSANAGFNYELFNGTTSVAIVPGAEAAIDYGLHTAAGTYTVMAIDTLTLCSVTMTGSATIGINPLPTDIAVSTGGAYCAGGAGVEISLPTSQSGVRYQVYDSVGAVGASVDGTGAGISFGFFTGAGAHTVIATDTTTSCVNTMSGSAIITINPLPVVYTVTGGGNYCPSGAGVHVGLSSSVSGFAYQLYNGTTPVGSPVAGVDSAIDFGLQTLLGTYTAVGRDTTTGCTANMAGSAFINHHALPVVHTVTGGGSYCASGAGLAVGLDSSSAGVNYQLYYGTTALGSVIAGIDAPISFGLQTGGGVYTVVATDTTTTCTNNMSGSATIVVLPLAFPEVAVATSTGSNVCAGTSVTFSSATTLGGTAPRYQWKVNGTNVGRDTTAFTYVPNNGDRVSVTLRSNEVCATPDTVSDTVTMTVNAIQTPSISVAADGGNNICRGSSVTFNATTTFGGSAPTYLWLNHGVPVGSSASLIYVPTAGDIISCVFTSNYTCRSITTVYSNDVPLTVVTPVIPTVEITSLSGSIVGPGKFDTLVATVTNGGTSPIFQWYIGSTLVTGATGNTLIRNNFTNGDSVTVVVTNSDVCHLSTFNSIFIKIGNVGVKNVTAGVSDIKLLPNPNKGEFAIKGTLATSIDQNVAVEVTNMLGQVVYKGAVLARNGIIDEKIQLSSSLANGMYMLNLHTDTETKVFHMVIEQ